MRIKKTSETTPIQAQVVNTESNSTQDTYSCDYINNAVKEVYSTDEQVIGTWIDGKPLYRKSFVIQKNELISPSSNTEYQVNVPVNSPAMTFINKTASFLYSKTGQCIQGMSYNSNEAYHFDFRGALSKANSADIYLYIGSTWYSRINYIVATLEYTKTTDTANT